MRRRTGVTRILFGAAGAWLVAVVITMSAVPARALLGADVSIQAAASPDPVEVGQDLTITLTVRNDGGVDANGVVVTDVLVASLTLSSAVPSLGSCSGSTTITCAIGTMSPGQVVTITMHVTPTVEGAVVNAAAVTALLDLDLTDNAALTTINVVAQGGGGGGGAVGSADLSLSVNATPDSGTVGVTLT